MLTNRVVFGFFPATKAGTPYPRISCGAWWKLATFMRLSLKESRTHSTGWNRVQEIRVSRLLLARCGKFCDSRPQTPSALRQGRPGLASWVIFSRPSGTVRAGDIKPRTTSWATFSRPFGTKAWQSSAVASKKPVDQSRKTRLLASQHTPALARLAGRLINRLVQISHFRPADLDGTCRKQTSNQARRHQSRRDG
jgi:hypothetical protein